MDKLVCVKDFAEQFSIILDRNGKEYFNSGSECEITLEENRNAFLRWLIKPRVLVDVSIRDTSTIVLGKRISFPFGVSPMAFQKVAHKDGEIAIAKAAESMGVIYTLSTFSTTSIEEVAKAAPQCRKWFQLFITKSRDLSRNMIKRAEASGFEAIVLTVDAQNVGKRRPNARNPFQFPAHLRLANFIQDGKGNTGAAGSGGTMENISMAAYVHNNLEQGLTWEIIKFIRSVTKLPIVLKGVLSVEDAHLAVHYGIQAIYVSNHGGRQVDTFPPTIDVLPEISKAAGESCEVYMDGGVMRGSDIFKARALGAKMVFAGRSLIWGLGVNGEDGAKKVLSILKEELDLTLALAGVARVDEITRANVTKSIKSLL